jgi:hypothetical protein
MPALLIAGLLSGLLFGLVGWGGSGPNDFTGPRSGDVHLSVGGLSVESSRRPQRATELGIFRTQRDHVPSEIGQAARALLEANREVGSSADIVESSGRRIPGLESPLGHLFVFKTTDASACYVFDEGAGGCTDPLLDGAAVTSTSVGRNTYVFGLVVDGVRGVELRLSDGTSVRVATVSNAFFASLPKMAEIDDIENVSLE